MKRTLIGVVLAATLAANAFATEVPTDVTVQNLNGSQQYIQTFTVSPDTDPEALKMEPFEYEGFLYTYASMTQQKNIFSDKQSHTQTVTVETDKKDLSAVLAALSPTVDYDDGAYDGTLTLNHTTIVTEAAGYATKSYAVSTTKAYDSLPSNDMSYIPATAVKDGVTLNLTGVDWQVQATALVDDVLIPSQYRAVATYGGTAWYSDATGYITTADYTGEISCSSVESVTYTLTYLGQKNISIAFILCAAIGLVILIVLASLLIRSRRGTVLPYTDSRAELIEDEYDDDEEDTQ